MEESRKGLEVLAKLIEHCSCGAVGIRGLHCWRGGTAGWDRWRGVSRRGRVCCWWWGNFCPTLGVWDEDWLRLGLLKAMTVVTDGMALEEGRSWQMYSAMLVQCLAELFPKISDLRLGDLLDGGL